MQLTNTLFVKMPLIFKGLDLLFFLKKKNSTANLNCVIFSLKQLGMASALETLCGQAYGAQQYQRIGTQIYTAIFCLFLVCFPLSFLWIYAGKLLVLIGQDPLISHEVGKYNLASSSSVCLCSNAGAYSIFSVSKFDHSHVLKLLCCSLFAYSHLLEFGIQVWTRKPWRSIGNWYIVLVECNFLGNLHEVLHCLCRIQGSNFNGVVPRNWRVLPLCYPFCSNGLVC